MQCIKHLCLLQRHIKWKVDDSLGFVESFQTQSSLLKCFSITFESSLIFFFVLLLQQVCVFQNAFLFLRRRWDLHGCCGWKGKRLFLVISVCVSSWKEQFLQFEQLVLNSICLEPKFLQDLYFLTGPKLHLMASLL